MTIELSGTTAKIHASEKVSTGDYENAEYHTTIEVDIDHTGALANGTREELKARLLALHKDAQATVARAAENRIREDGHEDWGVRE